MPHLCITSCLFLLPFSFPQSACYRVLDLLHMGYEVPFITTYRPDEYQPFLSRQDLWRLFDLDAQWERTQDRRKRLSGVAAKLRAHMPASSNKSSNSSSSGGLGGGGDDDGTSRLLRRAQARTKRFAAEEAREAAAAALETAEKEAAAAAAAAKRLRAVADGWQCTLG